MMPISTNGPAVYILNPTYVVSYQHRQEYQEHLEKIKSG